MGKDILYETMKIVAKQRNIKASPQHDLYKKSDILDITVKYCRFDELSMEYHFTWK